MPLLAPVTTPVPVRVEVMGRAGQRRDLCVGEVARQLAVGVGLGEQVVGLLLDSRDSVGAGHEAQRRLVLSASRTSAAASLAGSPPCRPFMLFQAATVSRVRSA